MSTMKFDIEKFDGRINFGLWQLQVNDLLILFRLHKALKGKPTASSAEDSTRSEVSKSTVSDEDWEELDLKDASTKRLCLTKNILANVSGISIAKGLWKKLEQVYQAKSLSNRLYLKDQFHTLHMEKGTRISNHMSIPNGIISNLDAIGVVITDEDKAMRLIRSLPTSYEHMKPILMHGKDKVIYSKVTTKFMSEERRLGSEKNVSTMENALVVKEGKKKNFGKVVCWMCGQSGHIKKKCPKGGACSAKDSNSQTNIVTFDDKLL